jgi:hypothetical protein
MGGGWEMERTPSEGGFPRKHRRWKHIEMAKRNEVATPMDEVLTEAAPTAPLDGEIIKPSNIPPAGQREVPVTRFDHTETVVKLWWGRGR